MFCKQWCGVVDGNRTFVDLYLFTCRFYFHHLFFTVFVFFLLHLCFLMDMFHHYVVLEQLIFHNGLVFLLCICLGKEDFYRHKGTVFFQYFAHTVFIGKFCAGFIEVKSDLCTNFCPVSILHLILCTAVTLPMYRNGSLFAGKCIDVDFICNHECRVKS